MDLDTLIAKLVDRSQLSNEQVSKICEQTAAQVTGTQLKIVELVKRLDSVLTNASHEIRLEGVKILVNVIISLPINLLSEKEIEVLNEFLCMRLIDHKSMQSIVLRGFAHFIKCINKPAKYNKSLLEFIGSKINVQKMEPTNRLQVYNIAKSIIQERRKISSNIDSDLIYSFVHLIEGENHPRNLIVCFGIVSYILRTFQNLEPYIDDLFEWLSCYYPVEYTPDEQDEEQISILRSDLVDALYDCFYATPLNAENLQTLLLEKLSSNLMSSKLESLECLIRCYEMFPYESVEKFASTLWTAVRMDCLKKSNLVNPKLLETSHNALYSLSKKLQLGDPDRLFTFLSDMLEELFIAFRKPEMDLFEPAARLLTQAAKPKLAGFNLILGKILPISLIAIESNELRPLEGLAYMFEELQTAHPNTSLMSDLDQTMNKMVSKLNTLIPENLQAMRLMNAITIYRVKLDKKVLDSTIQQLLEGFSASNDGRVEESLALICANYGRTDIVSGADSILEGDLNSLISFSKNISATLEGDKKSEQAKLSVYLRFLQLLLDSANSKSLKSIDTKTISQHLSELRHIAIRNSCRARVVHDIGRIHAVLFNKMDDIQLVLMEFFGSDYCQRLIPVGADDISRSKEVYLPIIGWCLKSLVVKNHPMSAPLVNLVLNFITSEKVDHQLAIVGSNLFGFVLSEEESSLFDKSKHYQVFVLYKQKFYMQTSKEIKIRYEKQEDDSKKNILLCSLAVQIPYLSLSIYKRDHEWLLRQLLVRLSKIDYRLSDEKSEKLLYTFYGSVEALIQPGTCDNFSGFLNTLVELNLRHANEATTMRIRQRALTCLLNVASSFKESDLIILRTMVVDKLSHCLKDKKRLVRQAAASARLRWSILGQPVGSNY